MNNNNNQKNKESDIITKKGFLISLPGKKNSEKVQSSIHLSSPKGDGANDALNGKKPRDDKKRNDADSRNVKNEGKNSQQSFGDGKNEQSHKHKDKFRRDKGGKNRDNRNNNNNNSGNNRQADKNGSREKEETASAAVFEKAENKNENRNENRNDRHSRHGKNHNRQARQNDSDRRDARENRENKDNRDNGSRDADKNRRNNDKKVKQAPLSVLSASISEYAEKQHFQETAPVKERELSLEEKYKNAKPLAQQIAEQEMRAKGIKVPGDEQAEVENVEIVGVRFREAGKIYYFDPDGRAIPFGTPVIVETARGNEYGYTAISNRLVPCNSLTSPLKKIQRVATEIDTQKHVANRDLEKQAEDVFREKVAKLGLEMNLIYVEYTFDNSRLLFYFTAETRIDFRELVKELASVFRTRIELRQIGVRDEAKAIGGIGVCGRANCCNTFLGDFAQVSIKMAKDQSLSLNAAKISGACGKLMCCLRYEDKVYEEENARTPKVGSIVETPEGKGHVVERNVLKGTVKVALDLAPEAAAQPFSRDDVKVVGFNKSKSEEDNSDDNLDELKDVEE